MKLKTNHMVHTKIKRSIVLFFSLSTFLFAESQNTIKTPNEIIKGKSLYFIKEDNNVINFFTRQSRVDDKEEIKTQKVFALKGNYGNIYFKWLNPLRYKVTWKDSIYIDDRDKDIKDLVLLFSGRFGINSTGQNKLESKNVLNSIQPNIKLTLAIDSGLREPMIVPENGFNNVNLTDLYLTLRDKDNQGVLNKNDIDAINKLTPLLIKMDEQINTGIANHVEGAIQILFKETEPNNAKQLLIDEKGNVKTYREATFISLKNLANETNSHIKALSISDALINSSIKTKVKKFLEECTSSLSLDEKTISKFESLLMNVDASLQDESEMKGFFRVRNATFNDGNILETAITISEYEINGDLNAIQKKTDVSTHKLIFKKYDFIEISVSAGIFYSNTTLKSFGIKPGNDNDFIVTEDLVEKNSAITALFGNINFSINSRYFSPLIQLGVDPTKKKPFILLGGGFSIPAASFSITGGGVWTWDQSLNKLSVGQKISSSIDLEKDMKNSFNVEPKGWYLGLQYNF